MPSEKCFGSVQNETIKLSLTFSFLVYVLVQNLKVLEGETAVLIRKYYTLPVFKDTFTFLVSICDLFINIMIKCNFI